MSKKFENAYDAGYDAGLNGANNFNSHFSWFNTKERMQEWQRGNNDGSAQRESENWSVKKRVLSTYKKGKP